MGGRVMHAGLSYAWGARRKAEGDGAHSQREGGLRGEEYGFVGSKEGAAEGKEGCGRGFSACDQRMQRGLQRAVQELECMQELGEMDWQVKITFGFPLINCAAWYGWCRAPGESYAGQLPPPRSHQAYWGGVVHTLSAPQ